MTPVRLSCFLHLLASPMDGLQYLPLLPLAGDGSPSHVETPCWQLSARELLQLKLHGVWSLIGALEMAKVPGKHVWLVKVI